MTGEAHQPERDPAEPWPSRADAFGWLIDRSHGLHPDDLPGAIDHAARLLGCDAASVLLVDLDQEHLSPLAAAEGDHDPVLVDSDASASRCYRHQTEVPVTATGGHPAGTWFALLDDSERLGVLWLQTDADGEAFRTAGRQLAGLTAELIVAKSFYGDTIVNTRRSQAPDLAAELRWALLPPLTFQSDRVEISALLEPAYEIAGDCFDYALNGSTVHVAILDAIGHGLEASRMANLAVTSYRHSRRLHQDLASTFTAMDEVVSAAFGPEKFVTGQLAEVDLDTSELRLLNAGHPLPLLVRGGRVAGQLAAETLLPVGLGDRPGELGISQLRPGDRVVFFSDGVTEARDAEGTELGIDRLAAIIDEVTARGFSLAETVRQVVVRLREERTSHLADDATIFFLGLPGS